MAESVIHPQGINSDFVWDRIGPNVVAVIDCDMGAQSVTNDVQNVVRYLVRRGLRDDDYLFYRDSTGKWDRILHAGGWGSGKLSFLLLQVGSIEQAMAAQGIVPIARIHDAQAMASVVQAIGAVQKKQPLVGKEQPSFDAGPWLVIEKSRLLLRPRVMSDRRRDRDFGGGFHRVRRIRVFKDVVDLLKIDQYDAMRFLEEHGRVDTDEFIVITEAPL
jgi:hypothetical protein